MEIVCKLTWHPLRLVGRQHYFLGWNNLAIWRKGKRCGEWRSGATRAVSVGGRYPVNICRFVAVRTSARKQNYVELLDSYDSFFGLCSFMFVMFESSGSGYLFFSVAGSDKHMWRYARSEEEVGQQHFKLIVKSTFLEFVQATRHSKIVTGCFIVGFSWHRKCVKWHRGWGPANNSLQKRSGTPRRTESTRKRIQWIQLH